MHEDLERLAAIDALDRSSHASRRRRDAARSALAEAESALAAAVTTHEQATAALEGTKQSERVLQRRLDEGRRHQGNALRLLETGQGDPAGAQRQLEKSTALIDELETEMLEVMEVEDAQQQACDAAKQAITDATSVRDERADALPGIESTSADELARDAAARSPLLDELPSDLRARYESFRAKGRWAVARLERGACNACYKVVQQQHITDIRRGLLKPCMGCHRWLVVDEDG